MAPIAAKRRRNAFRTIPDISFFDVEKKIETSNSRLPPEDGSVRPQTLGTRVSDDPRHFIFRHRNNQDFMANFFVEPVFLMRKNATATFSRIMTTSQEKSRLDRVLE